MEEYEVKYNRIKDLIKVRNLEGILITQQPNFSWLVGGRNYVNIQTQSCICKLLVTLNGLILIGNNIDIPLIFEEEIKYPAIKRLVSIKSFNWQETDKENNYIQDLLARGRYGSDEEIENTEYVGNFLYRLRINLSREEIERYRILGHHVAFDLEKVIKNIKRGDSELEIAGEIASNLYPKGILPIVILVAVDERANKYRHPIPTSKRLEKLALISVCGKKDGLVASATRTVHFGQPPVDLIRRHKAVTKIEARLFCHTRPGRNLADILKIGIQTYEQEGFGNEWKLHFQGGITGYNTREYKVTLTSTETVHQFQAFAWNPSISGAKSEDTFLVLPSLNEIITETGQYPYIEEYIANDKVKRPNILIRNI